MSFKLLVSSNLSLIHIYSWKDRSAGRRGVGRQNKEAEPISFSAIHLLVICELFWVVISHWAGECRGALWGKFIVEVGQARLVLCGGKHKRAHTPDGMVWGDQKSRSYEATHGSL